MIEDDADDYIPFEGRPRELTDEQKQRRAENFRKWMNDPKTKAWLDSLRRRAALGE